MTKRFYFVSETRSPDLAFLPKGTAVKKIYLQEFWMLIERGQWLYTMLGILYKIRSYNTFSPKSHPYLLPLVCKITPIKLVSPSCT